MRSLKKIIFYIFFAHIFIAASFSFEFFTKKTEEEPDIQEKYKNLSDIIPAYIMMDAARTSSVSQELLEIIQDKIHKAMVNTEKIKPVSLDKWLIGKYGLTKEKNIHRFINSLAEERYGCNVVGVCCPYVAECGEGYVLMLSFYRFSDGGYPITVLRKIPSLKYCLKAIDAMLLEYLDINESGSDKLYKKQKIVVKPFVLECRKYLGQDKGEFDYIPSTFIEQDGIVIRASDDVFSRLFEYSLNSTQMVSAMSTLNMNEYVEKNYKNFDFADFYIEGRIQLTDQINIYYINLVDAKTGKELKSVKFFTSDFSITGIWNANRNIIFSLADYIFGKNNYGVAPDITTPGEGLFLNNMYMGWDKLEKCVLPKGKHIVYTGDYYKAYSSVEIKNKNKYSNIKGNAYRGFFLYLDDRNWLFKGKDGERVWNLMEK